MNVALTSRYSPEFRGGIETVVRELAEHLAAARPAWRIHRVWAFDRKTFVSSFPLLCDIVGGLLIALRSRNADVVLINGAEYAWPFALAMVRARKVIIVWHGTRACEIPALTARMSFAVRAYRRIETWLQRLACRFDRHIAVSPTVVDELELTYGFSRHIAVIVNGAQPPAQAQFAANSSSRRVVWVGTHPYKKGLDVALTAIALARSRVPDLELRVVGVTAAETKSRKHPGVTFLGPLSPAQVRLEYAGAAAMLATTRYEACSMAVIEALAHGVPVIASPIIGWMIDGGGIVVSAFEPQAFSEALVRFFSEETDRAQLSARARARTSEFDWRKAARAYCTEIERCA